MKIALCDIGLGNMRSVERAIARAASDAGRGDVTTVSRAHDARALEGADAIVFPGQGGFGACAAALDAGLGAALRDRIRGGARYVGICLGMQLLFESSEEAPGARGLGIFPGVVKKLRPASPLKVPHCGWNRAEAARARPELFEGAPWFYFVHSYVCAPEDEAIVAARTTYGEPFVSAVAHGELFACQFHPEKSQAAGIALLGKVLFA